MPPIFYAFMQVFNSLANMHTQPCASISMQQLQGNHVFVSISSLNLRLPRWGHGQFKGSPSLNPSKDVHRQYRPHQLTSLLTLYLRIVRMHRNNKAR